MTRNGRAQQSLQKRWTEEVTRAVTAYGLAWRVDTALCTADGETYAAELTNVTTGKCKVITVPAATYPSPAERKVEIVRQLC